MTIQVETPDGGVAEFPDGTAPDIIRTAMRAKFGGGPAKKVAEDIKKPSGQERAKSQSDAFVKKLDQAMRSIAQGVTLGYADRIAARLESITGLGGKAGSYDENLKKE